MKLVKAVLEPLPLHWERRKDESGQTIYFNTLTQRKQVEKPKPLAPGWRMTKDKTTGQVYYWNVHTRETVACDEPPPPPMSSATDDDADVRRSLSVMEGNGGGHASQPDGRPRGPSFTAIVDDDLAGPSGPSLAVPGGFGRTRLPPPVALQKSLPPPMAPNATRVRLLNSDMSFAVSGHFVIVASCVASMQPMVRHVGNVLISINERPCPRDPEAALAQLESARQAASYVDIELQEISFRRSSLAEAGDSSDSVPRTISMEQGQTLSGEL